jgi:hypothetical protein
MLRWTMKGICVFLMIAMSVSLYGCSGDLFGGAIYGGAMAIGKVVGAIKSGQASIRDVADRHPSPAKRAEYGREYCPPAFADVFWEISRRSSDGSTGDRLRARGWKNYGLIAERLKAAPLTAQEPDGQFVFEGLQRSLRSAGPLTYSKIETVLSDAEALARSDLPGSALSASLVMAALNRSQDTYLDSSSEEVEFAANPRIAAVTVMVYEVLALEMPGNPRVLASAGAALELAAAAAGDPGERQAMRAGSYGYYDRAVRVSGDEEAVGAALRGGARVAAGDRERLALARTAMGTLAAQMRNENESEHWINHQASERSYVFFVYPYYDVPIRGIPSAANSPWSNDFTNWNRAIIQVMEAMDTRDGQRAALDIMFPLNRFKSGYVDQAGDSATLFQELYLRTGDDRWLAAAPRYLSASGISLREGWQPLADQAVSARSEFLARQSRSGV